MENDIDIEYGDRRIGSTRIVRAPNRLQAVRLHRDSKFRCQ